MLHLSEEFDCAYKNQFVHDSHNEQNSQCNDDSAARKRKTAPPSVCYELLQVPRSCSRMLISSSRYMTEC